MKWDLTFESFQKGLKQGGGKRWGWIHHLTLLVAKIWKGNDKLGSCEEFEFQLSIFSGYMNLSRNEAI